MRIQKMATLAAVGITTTGVGVATLIAAATSSSAAPVQAHRAVQSVGQHHVMRVAGRHPELRLSRAAATHARPADTASVTSTSVKQVAWTRRAEADTAPVTNKCPTVKGPDGQPIVAGGGGFAYEAHVVDAQEEADIASMYSAMAADDQAAYDAAYHRLALQVTCN